MRGMVESLNVSVAASALLFEALRQRQVANLIPESGEGLSKETYKNKIFEWAYPEVAKWCQSEGKKSLLKSKLKQIFLKHKLSKNHAEICSNYLVKAEILDAKGHGLARLKMYCDRIKAKVINPKPKIK